MQFFPLSMQKLIRELSKLPSIGEKSAARLAYHLINSPKLAQSLGDAMREATMRIKLCPTCFFFTDGEGSSCIFCSNAARDPALLCVVEKPVDLLAIERVGEFKGYYHVLHGLWSPLRGLGPESMRLSELMERVKTGGVKEVILATSSTVEGDATALYIAKLLKAANVKSTRLAQGLPKGGELEYADEFTLSRAFSGRSVINL